MKITQCVFCGVSGDKILLENEHAFAFWDAFPVTPLHLLVVPKRHTPDYFSITRDEFAACDSLLRAAEAMVREQDPPSFVSIYADFIAGRMILAATDLTVPIPGPEYPDNAWSQHRKDAEGEEIRDEVLEGIQLALAQDLSKHIVARAKRCKELTGRILAEKPPPPVLKYVRRLTRCYIAGFYPECVILCRGVMENAVKQQFGRKDVDIPATEDGKSTMRTILDAAKMFGWLTPQAHDDAWTIWTRGNKAVHEDIEVTEDVFGTIMMTINVLKELYDVVE